MEKLSWELMTVGGVAGVILTFAAVLWLGRAFLKRANFFDRGAWDRPLPSPIPKDLVVAVYTRRKRYHGHHRDHYVKQHSRRQAEGA
jgi:hypothetical protein